VNFWNTMYNSGCVSICTYFLEEVLTAKIRFFFLCVVLGFELGRRFTT
jgi:hypothetical protein